MGRQSKGKEQKREVRAASSDRRNAFAKVRSATVAFAIQNGDNSLRIIGSGVIVDVSGIVVTARHVVEDLQTAVEKRRETDPAANPRILIPHVATYRKAPQNGEPKLEFQYGVVAPKTVLSHGKTDVAVLKIPPPMTLTAVSIDYECTPSEGDIVGACGFPYGTAMHEGKTILSSFLTGIVSAVVPHPVVPRAEIAHYGLQLPVNPGNSGGPVFDLESGCLIGIVSRRFEVAGMSTGVCIAEPIHQARDGIEALLKE